MDIENLIRIYTSSAINLRKVADLAEEKNPDSDLAKTSRAKAATYELVIDDLNTFLAEKKDY